MPSLIPGTQSRPADIFSPELEEETTSCPGCDCYLHHCSCSPYKELLLHQGMPLPWVRKGSGPLILKPVIQLVSVLSLWSLSLWVDGAKRRLTPSPVLVVYWVNVWESLLVNLSDTFSSDVLYLYGEATRPSGFVVIPFILRQLMVS